MLEILPESYDQLVIIRASGKLTGDDYKQLNNQLKELINGFKHTNLVCIITDFQGWQNWEAIDADFKMVNTFSRLERVAFVTDNKFHQAALQILSPCIHHTSQQFFPPDQLQAAIDWANTNTPNKP